MVVLISATVPAEPPTQYPTLHPTSAGFRAADSCTADSLLFVVRNQTSPTPGSLCPR